MRHNGTWRKFIVRSDDDGQDGMWKHEGAPTNVLGTTHIFVFRVSTGETCRILVRKANDGLYRAWSHIDKFHDDVNDTTWWNALDGKNFCLLDENQQVIPHDGTKTLKAMKDVVSRTRGLIYTPPAVPKDFF